MHCRSQSRAHTARRLATAGFTLAEVLAALTFMAIVIPAAIHGLQIANRAGQVGQRKAAAARIADRVMSELLVTGQMRTAAAGGVVEENDQQYQWSLRSEPWQLGNMRVVTIQVAFAVQGRDYQVQLSTLVDNSY